MTATASSNRTASPEAAMLSLRAAIKTAAAHQPNDNAAVEDVVFRQLTADQPWLDLLLEPLLRRGLREMINNHRHYEVMKRREIALTEAEEREEAAQGRVVQMKPPFNRALRRALGTKRIAKTLIIEPGVSLWEAKLSQLKAYAKKVRREIKGQKARLAIVDFVISALRQLPDADPSASDKSSGLTIDGIEEEYQRIVLKQETGKNASF